MSTRPNCQPRSSAEYLFNIYQTWLAAGFTRKGSSDGTSFDNTGAVDHWPDVAHVDHAGSWVRVTDPANGAEYTLQFDGMTRIRRKYSRAAKFVSGAPSATQTPLANDEQVISGGGTDAAPVYKDAFPSVPGTQQVYVDGASAPYPFYSIGYPTGGGAPNHAIVSDAVDNLEGADPDALSHDDTSSGACLAAHLTDPVNGPVAWLYYDVPASRGFVCCPMLSNQLAPGNADTSVRSARDWTLAITYARTRNQVAPNGYKGTSRLFRWAAVAKSTPQAGTASISGDREIAGDLVCVWDHTAGAWV